MTTHRPQRAPASPPPTCVAARWSGPVASAPIAELSFVGMTIGPEEVDPLATSVDSRLRTAGTASRLRISGAARSIASPHAVLAGL